MMLVVGADRVVCLCASSCVWFLSTGSCVFVDVTLLATPLPCVFGGRVRTDRGWFLVVKAIFVPYNLSAGPPLPHLAFTEVIERMKKCDD